LAKITTEPYFYYNGTKKNIGPNTITISFTCTVSKPSSETMSYDWRFRSYNSDDTIIETLYEDSRYGTVTLDINAGEENYIKAWAKISYEDEDGNEEFLWGSKNSYEAVYPDDESMNCSGTKMYVYARNSATYDKFWKDSDDNNIASGKYIDQHITISNINQWIRQLGIWSSWREQEDNYYSNVTIDGVTRRRVIVPNLNTSSTTDTVTITTPLEEQDITAAWYKNCANGCKVSTTTIKGLSDVTDPADATYIAADHFINLAKAVTTWS
jgi:hypothetical protein